MDRGQAIFLGVAAVFLIYQALSGWRLGVVRQLLKILSLVAAYLGGVFLGDLLVPMLRLTGYPDMIIGPVAAIVMGLLCYFAATFASRILFKKTTDQDVGTVWFFYGITGSLLGVVFGLFFVAFMAIILRFMGSLATGISAPVAEGSTFNLSPRSKRSTVAGLVEMKQSLETGITGSVLDTIDPVPNQAYAFIEKIGRVSTSPAAMHRFFTYPGAAELAQRPEIRALQEDPEINQALRQGHYLALLKNPKVAKAANHPKVAELIRSFDLNKALDHAIGEGSTAPTPSISSEPPATLPTAPMVPQETSLP